MGKASTLAKNTILIAVSKLSTSVITFLMLPLYTAFLSTEEYGIVDLVMTYAALAAPLLLLNIEMAAFRYLIDARNDEKAQKRIITNSLEIVSVFGLVALITFAIVAMIFRIPMAASMALYFAAASLSSLVLFITRGLGNTKAFAVTSIAQGILSVIFNVLFLAVFKMGPAGILLGLSLGAIIPIIILALMIKIPRRINLAFRSRAAKKELINYSLPLIPNSVSWWVFNVSDRTIISLVLGVAANGIYAVSNKFSGVLSSLWGIFYVSWSESASVNIGSPNRDRFFSEVANVSARIFGGLSVLGIALTPLAFPLLANASYGEALLYVPVLMMAGFFSVVVGFYSAIYVAKKMTRQVMYTSVVSAVINLVVNLGLVWFIGIWAAAISTLAAYAAMAIYRHYDMKKYVKIRYERLVFVKLALVFAVVAGLYYLNHPVLNLVNVGVAVLAAVGMNWGVVRRLPGLMGAVLKKK